MGVWLLPIPTEDTSFRHPNMTEFLSCLILHREITFIRFRFGM